MKKEISYCKNKLFLSTIDLLSKEKISEISISEIVSYAKVGRATFYRYFNSIEDLLIQYEEMLEKEFEDKNPNIKNSNIREVLYSISKHFLDNKKFYMTIYYQNLSNDIFKILEKNINSKITKSSTFEKYGIKFILYGIYGFITVWIEDDMKLSPEELVNNLENYYLKHFNLTSL